MNTLRRSISLLAAVCMLALAGGCTGPEPAQSLPSEVERVVETEPAALEDITDTFHAMGTVRASEKAEIRPQVDGVVAEILFREGGSVAQGEPLVRLDDRKASASLALAKAALDSARARLAVAEQKMVRNRRLFSDKLVSRDKFDEIEAEYKAADATVREQEAAASLAARELEDYELRAPFAGTVGARLVDVGNYVERGSRLAVLMQTDPAEVSFAIPDQYSEQLRVGTQVSVAASHGGKPFAGIVTFINPRMDPGSRMLQLKATVSNPRSTLRDGQFVEVTVVLAIRKQRVVAAEQAIVPLEGKSWVFVVEVDRARRREVTLGTRLPQRVEIRSGVKAGDILITAGQHRLHDGDRVTQSPVEDPPES